MAFDFHAAVREIIEDEGGTDQLTTEDISKAVIKVIPEDAAEALLYDLVHSSVSREVSKLRGSALRRFRAADPATLSSMTGRDPRLEQIRADFWSSRVWINGTYKVMHSLTAADCDAIALQRERSAEALAVTAASYRKCAKLIQENNVVVLGDLDEATVQAAFAKK